ncbi:hypothetical protein Syun_003960 [Stephania yunnanensis]|uniref:Uncharacterized protein n=1 Tax=Stephania yunnanensis TaxID=152371 RepID=A0AAP0Q0Q6_9MAGN
MKGDLVIYISRLRVQVYPCARLRVKSWFLIKNNEAYEKFKEHDKYNSKHSQTSSS